MPLGRLRRKVTSKVLISQPLVLLLPVLLFSVLFGALPGAAQPFNSHRLIEIVREGLVDTTDPVVLGAVMVNSKQVSSTGGQVVTNVLTGPCRGQLVRFSWSFDQDVARIYAGHLLKIHVLIDRPNGNYCALPAGAGPMSVTSDGGAKVNPALPNGQPMSFLIPVPGQLNIADYTVSFDPQSMGPLFKIGFASPGEVSGGWHAEFTYRYAGDSTTNTCAQDMLNVAGRDRRFGAAVPGTFQSNPTWQTGYELSWMDFSFSGGRRVRMFCASQRGNPLYRWAGFFDPDTNGRWTGWMNV